MPKIIKILQHFALAKSLRRQGIKSRLFSWERYHQYMACREILARASWKVFYIDKKKFQLLWNNDILNWDRTLQKTYFISRPKQTEKNSTRTRLIHDSVWHLWNIWKSFFLLYSFLSFFLQFTLKILIEFVTTLFKGGIFLWVTSIQCSCQSMREIALERTGR